MMRVRGDIDQKVLAELFYQYLNVEEDFVRDLFTRGETQLGRAFVNEEALAGRRRARTSSTTSGRARWRARPATRRRHLLLPAQDEHVGQACDAPMDICMTFNTTAVVAHPPRLCARRIDAAEGLDLLEQARAERGSCSSARTSGERRVLHLQLLRLLLRGDDRRAAVRVPAPGPHDQLPAGASIASAATAAGSASRPARSRRWRSSRRTTRGSRSGERPELDEEACLGCGVCVADVPPRRAAPRRVARSASSRRSARRTGPWSMAIERGQLQT